ncbi:GNAT family N-acetyltransferase [Parafrankia sp. EUN1f]|uniref:GNAT family N-acetyltransferase n=1 Tax=Parafrankia sp. EUN1f TaxID=102897 RepID=UPI0001C47104|nr:GNAT family protein [Parafrankia sp. EUN1f]EFC79908.1 GCN5-related N-acetyltransferase [Parafrankia sp. EUN1f]
MSAPGWPAVLRHGDVVVRPMRLRDAGAWVEVRSRNADWLAPWEATRPGAPSVRETWNEHQTFSVYSQMMHRLRAQSRAGAALAFVIAIDGRLAGQLTVSTIVRGAFNSAQVGYWLDGARAGRGITPTALALVTDHCFGPVGLHRLEANVRPENAASRRMLTKLGFREEGLHRRFLAIDGEYRDHICFALTTEDVPGGLLARWSRARSAHS